MPSQLITFVEKPIEEEKEIISIKTDFNFYEAAKNYSR